MQRSNLIMTGRCRNLAEIVKEHAVHELLRRHRYHEEFALDLSDLNGARAIVIVGPNGAGKSTLLESIVGAVWGDMPSRGAIARIANARDSFIELHAELDQEYTVRRLINAVPKSPKTEVYLFGADGSPISDGKQTTFDAEVAKRFPSQRIYLSSAFAAQKKSGQFLRISKAERKTLFAELLGLGHLEAMAKAAGEHARATELELAKLTARADTLGEQAARRDDFADDVGANESTHAMAVTEREDAERRADDARAALEMWRTRESELQQAVTRAQAELGAATRKRDHIQEELAREKKQLAKLSAQRASLEDRLSRKAEIEQAVAEAKGTEERLAELDNQKAELLSLQHEHANAEFAWQEKAASAAQARRNAEHAHQRAIEVARRELDSARRELERAEHTAAGLGKVPCGGEGDFATCPLIANAAQARNNLDELRLAGSGMSRVSAGVKAGGSHDGMGDGRSRVDPLRHLALTPKWLAVRE